MLPSRIRRHSSSWLPAWWLGLIAAVSVLGALALVVVPSGAGAIWSTGILVNVAATIGLGGVLAWSRRWQDLALSLPLGIVVVIAGIDLGCVADGGTGASALWALDLVGIVIAAAGLSVLLLAGVIAGTAAQLAYATYRGRHHAH